MKSLRFPDLRLKFSFDLEIVPLHIRHARYIMRSGQEDVITLRARTDSPNGLDCSRIPGN